MKILYVDCSVKGHHIPYLKEISKNGEDAYFILPKKISELPAENQFCFTGNLKSIFGYCKWLRQILSVAKKENVNIIHFLYGDICYRFFGLGLNLLRKYMVIMTFHQIRKGFFHNISLKQILKCIDKGVVHTKILETYLNSLKIINVTMVEYPVFEKYMAIPEMEARLKLEVKESMVTFLYFGGTRHDKGMDIFLDAVKMVNVPLQIIIAGSIEFFTEEEIQSRLQGFKGEVTTILRFIREDEIPWLFSASDCVVLPYRKIFDGASGPLGIGCLYGKKIIGPNHGSIGEIIRNNHLGEVFCAEDKKDLAKVLEKTCGEVFLYDEYAIAYREKLKPMQFIESYKKIYNERKL